MQDSEERRIKIKDLPIYTTDDRLAAATSINKQNYIYVSFVKEKTEYEKFISSTRQLVFDYIDKFSEQKERAVKFYETGVEHTRSTLEYIRSETNILPKLTFISLSAAAGVVFGYKRSNFRKFTYSTLFTATAVAICYPNETKKYSSETLECMKNKTKAFYDGYIMPPSPQDAIRVVASKQEPIVIDDSKHQVVTLKSSNEASKIEIVGDKGQSNDDDQDMYTTRSK